MIQLGPIEKLGTTWWFEFFSLQADQAETVQRVLLETMEEFEAAYSRFRPTSLLSQLNDTGVSAEFTPEFRELLQIGLDAYQATGGVFNCAVGAYLERTGYDASYSFTAQDTIVPPPALPEVLQLTDTMARLRNGARLDFGGFGKGYLIDKLARVMREQFKETVLLINGGGDLYIGDTPDGPIKIGLQHPEQPKIVGSMELSRRGFAASSPNLRRWTDQHGVTHTHLVGAADPRPVYVTAPTATQADIWSTTLSIASVSYPDDVQAFMWSEVESQVVPYARVSETKE